LQKHRIFLDKSPGPISKRDLVPMGFWMHVHPGFASTRAFHNQVSNESPTTTLPRRSLQN
jgi:hypothetical protein